MTSLFRNISEKHDGHMQISLKNVPSCDEIISLPEEERNCPTCGTQMECIGKEFVRHEFRFTPAKGKVVNIYRETYKCPECAISEEHPDDQTFVKALSRNH